MAEPQRVLVIEDRPADAALTVRELRRCANGVETQVVGSGAELRTALAKHEWDLVLSDYSLPSFTAIDAFAIVREMRPGLPFVVLSGTIGEERAVELMKLGVTDYVLKDNMTRLVAVVERAVNEARDRSLLTDAQRQLVVAGREWHDTFDAISEGILLLSPSGRVHRLNSAAPRLLGLAASDVMDATAREVLIAVCSTVDDLPDFRSPVSVRRFELGPCGADQRWLSITSDTVRDSERGACGVVLVISDITESKVAEGELRSLVARLGRSMKGAVSIAARMVESRDPYTAGHQERVAAVAVAIAERQGCPVDMVENIRTAALLHDIGKIGVPAEILVRPGALTEVERSLMTQHPAVGAEILKDAELEGPIAEIVRQHHERLDGSGYPDGLTADEICPEARIIAVADVTEAMMSHRPYRPALSSQEMIAELTAGSGLIYDSRAVEACLSLVREGRMPGISDATAGPA